jgi:hypothetical protein
VNYPELSETGRAALEEMHQRDAELFCSTGFAGPFEIREHLLGFDADAREELAVDGLRWRHYCSLVETNRRAIESERAIRAEFTRQGGARSVGPPHAELQRRRAVDPHRPCSWPGCGDDSGRQHSHQPAGERKEAS